MCRVMEDMRKETELQTQKKERSNFARVLWDMGIHNLDEIAQKVQLPKEDVEIALRAKTV